ncbi:MAG: L,D-transpeptidase family protein [Selenomonadaceae bacterium]|nr:L,D-transpeptidase family protein [Selenomonadaceae bacterium]
MWKKLLATAVGVALWGGALPGEALADGERVLINVASHSLALYRGDDKIRLYPIATGKISTPTPTGYYKILSKDVNPTWTDPTDHENVIPSGPYNPLGYRWMQIKGNYGIHGTNNPSSIGKHVSNGCIRMNESDVEALFDLVSVGTPVEITYNRIVVEKTADGNIAYYIYPDAYRRQPLDAAGVRKWLDGFGVGNFASNEDIEAKIAASDGEPTYLGKPYKAKVNSATLKNKAVQVNGITYLPAQEVALALKLDLKWSEEAATLTSPYGKAKGYDKNDILYFASEDAPTLFHLKATLNRDNEYDLTTLKSIPTTPTTNQPSTVKPPVEPGIPKEPQGADTLNPTVDTTKPTPPNFDVTAPPQETVTPQDRGEGAPETTIARDESMGGAEAASAQRKPTSTEPDKDLTTNKEKTAATDPELTPKPPTVKTPSVTAVNTDPTRRLSRPHERGAVLETIPEANREG